MTQNHGPEDPTPEAAELEHAIEHTREDLARTVDQLAGKLDVKARVRDQVAEAKDEAGRQARTLREQMTDEYGRPTPAVIGVLATAAAALLVLVLWRRRHRARRRWRR